MHPVEQYIKDLGEIRRTGSATRETSYYGTLERLLNEVGGKLKPKVRCVSQLSDTGAGFPDYGLFTANQFQKTRDDQPIEGQLPERGVVEVKGWDDDSLVTARGAQVTKYWKKYGLVLVTNYRDFVLIGRDEQRQPVWLESYSMAESEEAFVGILSHPRKVAQGQGDRLVGFLRRVMTHSAPLTEPEDLAWFLASYAREARARIDESEKLAALDSLKTALEDALGMKFEGEKGEHFFRATLVQTLFYGVFSSWVLWARQHPKIGERFNWHEAGWTLHVPMVKGLFDQIATPTKLKPLRIDEVLNWTGQVLNRVDREAFFTRFEEEHAVQYFYEPFLKAYDPELRKDLGVWYTPPEIVKYQVERVDQVLRTELGLADGLADEQVVVLDPCCGTGAYLVETLKRIHKTLEEKGSGATTAQKLKRAATRRVFGFEILPAPSAVSHLQIGFMLRLLGAPIDADSDERAGVYLTNALTGWEPPKDPKKRLPLPFPELEEERDKATKVKRDEPILVVIGNPPYNAFAGTSPDEEGGLVDAYKEGLTRPIKQGGWGIKKFNLDDLYVRFFRIAERRIAKSGRGVVSYISNYSWTEEPSFVALRKHLLQSFDKFWVENMHGNRKKSEYAPDGRTSETVFAIPGFSAGIRQGVVISLWVKRDEREQTSEQTATVIYRDDIDAARAVERRDQLINSLRLKQLDRKYERAEPSKENRYSFRPQVVSEEYLTWPKLNAFSEEDPVCGYKENRGFAMIDDDRDTLAKRMRLYFDSSVTWEELGDLNTGLTRDAARFDAKKARHKVLAVENYTQNRVVRYQLRPFDRKWCYYCPVRPLWNEPRPALYKNHFEGNSYLVSRPSGVAAPEGSAFHHTSALGDFDFIRGHSYHFPIMLRATPKKRTKENGTSEMFGTDTRAPKTTANLSKTARTYLSELGIKNPDKDIETAGIIWMHALAIGYSPNYLSENADGIRQNWPRIPLPKTKQALLASAKLGRQVAALLDTETDVPGVTSGKVDNVLRSIAVPTRIDGGQLDPAKGDWDITAGWGHGGKGGICMPGKGRTESRKASYPKGGEMFGDTTLDIYLNDVAYWCNIPQVVWNFHIGGYQVIKKWLSYREKTMLGRGLKLDEVEYVTNMTRRIAALVLMQAELDQNYQQVKSAPWSWVE
ncbi:MAG: DNA methyltransferase [Candidatus Zixiibacteriota bacterium]|nr:MAG: DNA methyltransferase [candidate division Zixibacteria bacterium]